MTLGASIGACRLLHVRPDKPSLTAVVVSFLRGAVSHGSNPACYDPVAPALLPSPWRQLLLVIERPGRTQRWGEGLVRVVSGGLARHLELRTALIDAAVKRAVEGGVKQLVIVGAGLDSRPWRLTELSDVDVYEVDHPATQAWKKGRATGLHAVARSVQFVPVDFERQSLADALTQTTHDAARPTLWLWEAVTMYLPHTAIASTLADMAKRSSKGSTLVATYLTPDLVVGGPVAPLALPVFRLLSEPLIGMMQTPAWHAVLGEHGFRVETDTLPSDADRRSGRANSVAPVTPAERVVVARH